MKANTAQIIKNIVNAIEKNPAKLEQLKKVNDITVNCTSSDSITIKCEMFGNNIVRFTITGTRSQMTITVNAITNEIARKPRNEEPWNEETLYNVNCYEIFEELKERQENEETTEEETASAEDQTDSKKAEEINEKIEKIENHLEWIYGLFHKTDPKRLIDESFGFIQGVEFFDEELYEEINKRNIWTDFYIKCINEGRRAAQ